MTYPLVTPQKFWNDGRGDLDGASGIIPLTRFGVRKDTSADQTAAIQSAIDSGEPIGIPRGTFWHSGLQYKNGTCLVGASRTHSILALTNGSNQHCLRAAANDLMGVRLANFTIYGNKANQSSGDAVYMDDSANAAAHRLNSPYAGLAGLTYTPHDPRHQLQNLMILSIKGNGLTRIGRGSGTFSHIHMDTIDGHGIDNQGFDDVYTHIDMGGIGLHGIYNRSTSGMCVFNGFKIWYTGQIDRATSGDGIFDSGARHTYTGGSIQNAGRSFYRSYQASRTTMSGVIMEGPSPTPVNLAPGMFFEEHNGFDSAALAIYNLANDANASMNYGVQLHQTSTNPENQNVIVRGFISLPTVAHWVKTGTQTLRTCAIQFNGGANDIYTWRYKGWVPTYQDDAAASAASLGLGYEYINSKTNMQVVRLGSKVQYGTTAPASGAYVVGDIVWNTAVAAGGTVGWVCTTAGSPGTWKTFGAVAA